MVRNSLFIVFFLLLNSCSSFKRNDNGIPRVSKNQFSKLDPVELPFDTQSTIYKLKANFYQSENEIKYYKLVKPKKNINFFLVFLENGKVATIATEMINKDSLDPKRGQMGFYGQKKGKIFIERFYRGDGGGYVSHEEMKIYDNDSIVLIEKNRGITSSKRTGWASSYTPVKVTKGFLELKPDW